MLGAHYSGRVENKAHRIINGTDDTIKLQDQVLFEKFYYSALPYITPVHPALPTVDREVLSLAAQPQQFSLPLW
jgi:hypothetical protein